MGRIICKTHGETGIVLTCSHLSQDIQDRVKFRKVITASDKEFGEAFVSRYCPDCAAEYNFPTEDSEMPGEKFDSTVEKNFSPNCYDCFKELDN